MKRTSIMVAALLVAAASGAAAQGTALSPRIVGVKCAVPAVEVQKESYQAASVDNPVKRVSGPDPRYPAELAAAKVKGQVTLQFVVGTDGRAEYCSIQAMEPSDSAFISAARDNVAAAQYTAAEMRGTKVRQLVSQVIKFTLEKDKE